MASPYGTLTIPVTADTRPLAGQVRSAATTAGRDAARSIGSTLSSGLRDTGKAAGRAVVTSVGIAAGAMVAFGVKAARAGIQANQAAAQARIGFKSLLGSQQAANDMMDRLGAVARRGIFGRTAFVEPARQLLAVGMNANQVVRSVDAIGLAVQATTGRAEDIGTITTALARVQSTGKFTSRTFVTLSRAGIDAAGLIARGMNMSVEQVRTGLQKGTIDTGRALAVLTQQMQRQYAGSADAVLNTWSGARAVLRKTFIGIGADMVEPFISRQGGGLAVGFVKQLIQLLRAVAPAVAPVSKALAGSLVPQLGRFSDLMGKITGVVQRFTSGGGIGKLTAQIKTMGPALLAGGGGLAALAGGAAGAALNIPVLSPILSNLTGPMKQLGLTAFRTLSQLGGAEAGTASLGAALKGLTTPAGLAAAGLGLMLAASPELRAVLMELAKELLAALLPAIREIALSLRALMPAVTLLARQLGGVLAVALRALVPLIQAFGAVLRVVSPVLPAIVAGVIAWSAAQKVLTAAQAAGNLVQWVSFLAKYALGVELLTVKTVASALASKVAAAAQWVWNAALAANPIGLVVVALAALVVGVVIAYKRFAWFRSAVSAVWGALQAVWSWTRRNWPLLLAVLLGPLGLGVAGIVRYWSQIRAATTTAFRAVRNTISSAWSGVSAATRTATTWVTARVSSAWSSTVATTRARWNATTSAVSAAWTRMRAATSAATSWITSRVSSAWSSVLSRSRSMWNAIVNAIRNAFNRVVEVVKQPVRTVVNKVIRPLIWGINKLISKIGIPKIPDISLGFAAGGKVPGRGRGDIVPAMLEPGETVVTRALSARPDFRAWARYHGIPGYLKGGVVPDSPARFAAGPLDFIGKGWNAVVGAGKGIVSEFGKYLRVGVAKAFEVMTRPLVKLVEPLARSPHVMTAWAGKNVQKVIAGAVKFIQGKEETPMLGGGGPGVAALAKMVIQRFPQLVVTSALRPGDPGYHGKGWARDLGGPVGVMNAAARWMAQTMTPMLLEGIHNPGLSVKNYKQVPPGFWGSGTWGAHRDHIHMAAEPGAGPGASFGGGPAGLRKIVAAVAQRFGVGWAVNLAMARIKQESGFNQRAVNRWDSNWQAGTPSVGYAQLIRPTYLAYRGPYTRGPWLYGVSIDPWAQIFGMFNYSIARYGRGGLNRAWSGTQGYAQGGILNEPVMGLGLHSLKPYSFGENAPAVPEQWTPLDGSHRPGSGVTINVYPARGQSETEIAAAVDRRLAWARSTGRSR